jgi:hypothetical protein
MTPRKSLLRMLAERAARFREDRDGAMLVTYALVLPGLMGVAGLGIETGIWYTASRSLQTASDAAALSGAFERAKGHPTEVVSAATLEAVRNGFENAAPNTIVINNPPVSGSNEGDQSAVEVVLGEKQSLLFSSLFVDAFTIRARSVAAVEVTGTACVLALDPTANAAINNQGNPNIDMEACVLAANSTSSSAIALSGSAFMNADSLWTAGNITVGASVTLTLEDPPTVNAWPIPDPYADVLIPSFGACQYNNTSFNNVTLTINPGVYCDGINFGANANITLNPGTYFINEGDINIAATARLRCSCPDAGDGVTFVLTAAAPGQIGTIVINGGADVLLNAPTSDSDPFKGILFYQDRRAPSGQAMKFNGGSSMLLTGAIYVPKQNVEWSGGNAAAGSTCTQIIGRTVSFVGNSNIVNTGCDEAGISPLEIVGVRIVE